MITMITVFSRRSRSSFPFQLFPGLRPAVQAGALRGVPVHLHGPDQELSGRVRGGKEDQLGCCGGGRQSVGGGADGKLLDSPVRFSAPGRL